jgi:hypothetical protein
VEELAAIGLDDLADFIVGNAGENFDRPLSAVGPVGVRMGVIGLPEDPREPNLVTGS